MQQRDRLKGRMNSLPELSEASAARVRSATQHARTSLLREVIQFFERCRDSEFIHIELERKPVNYDLMPYFTRYATDVFRAEAKERIDGRQNLEQCTAMLNELAERTVHEIVRNDGTWASIVKSASEYVDLGAWDSEYGEYSGDDFQRPRPAKTRLLRILKLPIDECLSDYLKQVAEDGPATSDPKSLAEWLRSQMESLGWTPNDFGSRGPDRKTIQKILNGGAVTMKTIRKLAKALSAGLGKEVLPSEIPKK